jgi:hypothetical protein
MRRSLLAGIGALAVFIFAACSPDQTRQEPLAPADVGLAKGGGGGSQACGGGLASDIAKLHDDLYNDDAETQVELKFDAVKAACPVAAGAQVLMDYLDVMTSLSGAPGNNATALVDLLGKATLYATGTALVRPASIFQTKGGAAVLSPGESMTTWGASVARLEVQNGTETEPAVPAGDHLWTLEPRPASECGGITSLRVSGHCFQIHDYPHSATVAYDPPFIVTLCHPSSTLPTGSQGIGHEAAAFNGKAEVLQETEVVFGCAHVAKATDSWLGRDAGPFGRALAKAYDYLRPQPLFADDAGESGLGLFTSLFGEILHDTFEDNFDLGDSASFNDGVDAPDLTDFDGGVLQNWLYNAPSPGFIRIQDALGDMSGGVVVLSQAQGACNNCPVFQLLGEVRTDDETEDPPPQVVEPDHETVGSFDVFVTSLQNKPNIKEAPFVLLNSGSLTSGTTEIVRLSYVTVSNQNKLQLKVKTGPGPNSFAVYEVPGIPWVQNVQQSFRITVKLDALGNGEASLAILTDGTADPPVYTEVITPKPAPFATTLKYVGYRLTGIDAGIIASDNWKVTRKSDIP